MSLFHIKQISSILKLFLIIGEDFRNEIILTRHVSPEIRNIESINLAQNYSLVLCPLLLSCRLTWILFYHIGVDDKDRDEQSLINIGPCLELTLLFNEQTMDLKEADFTLLVFRFVLSATCKELLLNYIPLDEEEV